MKKTPFKRIIQYMVITYLGGNYFKIQSGEFVVLVDPTNARSFKGSNVVLNTIKSSAVTEDKENADLVWIENQGEYEVKGTHIVGYHAEKEAEEKTCFLFKLEDISVGILGQLTEEPSPEIVENLSEVDILIIPGGGKPFLSESSAAKLARQMEPAIIIPGLFENSPKKFASELSQNLNVEEKFVVKKKDISPGAMKLVCLSAK